MPATFLPSPTLILGVGDFASRLLSQVQATYLRSDARRAMMVGFYKAVAISAEDMKFEAISKNSGAVVGNMQAQASSGLEPILHDLRLHEKFLEVGLGDEQDLPLGMIVLIDLTEPGSNALYPLVKALLQKTANELGCYMYLLCKTAVFSADSSKNVMQARLHLHFSKLEALIKEAGWRCQIFLFDELKEGLLEAKDEDEIGLLMQNFLLALLSGRLGQELAYVFSSVVEARTTACYHSAGTTALVYDPTVLKENCAVQFAVKVLEAEFLSEESRNPQEIARIANTILYDVGSQQQWVEELCTDAPYRAKIAEAIRLDLHLSELEFEGLPPQEWGDEIVGYAAHFEKDLQTGYFESLKKNSEYLSKTATQSLEAKMTELPARSDLYPNGVAAALQVIQECERLIHERIRSCLPAPKEEEMLASLDRDYESAMRRLDELISELPEPPRWMKHLPGKLRVRIKFHENSV